MSMNNAVTEAPIDFSSSLTSLRPIGAQVVGRAVKVVDFVVSSAKAVMKIAVVQTGVGMVATVTCVTTVGVIAAAPAPAVAQAFSSFNTLAPTDSDGRVDFSNGFTLASGTTASLAAPSDPFNGSFAFTTIYADSNGFSLQGDPNNADDFTLKSFDFAYGGFRGATNFSAAPTSGIFVAYFLDGSRAAWGVGTESFSVRANVGQTVNTGRPIHGGTFSSSEAKMIVLFGAAAKPIEKLAFAITGTESDPNDGGNSTFFLTTQNSSIAPDLSPESYRLVKNFGGVGEPIITQISAGAASNFQGFYPAVVVPEPATFVLFGFGLTALASAGLRKSSAKKSD